MERHSRGREKQKIAKRKRVKWRRVSNGNEDRYCGCVRFHPWQAFARWIPV
jgi:hypothetical protein